MTGAKPSLAILRRWRLPAFAYAELGLGLTVAIAGVLHTLAAFPSEWHELSLRAHHGVALLGAVVTLRAVAEVGVYTQFAGEWSKLEAGFWARFHHWLAGPHAEGLVGLLVILSGFGEAYRHAVNDLPHEGHWHWGLVIFGLTMLARTAYDLLEGLEKLEHSRVPTWVHRLAALAERPAVQLVVAVLLVTLAGLELAFPLPVEAQELGGAAEGAGAATGPHGMGLLGGVALTRALPDLIKGSRLAASGIQHARHHAPPEPHQPPEAV
ncbi:MAG: hypothetical protein VKP62_12435 [Candidatus Sericytochromatia bacterium]|nr:hypothetical protein [Candidatus Sericytochromatia bacterium]